jgi:TRAP-type C4-dicarboxylate transport system substrate-binding protein
MTRSWTLGALVATALVLGGCLGGSDANKAGGERERAPVVLTLANHAGSANNLDEFAKEVERSSDGGLRIEFKNRWREGESGYERKMLADVRGGRIDLANVGVRTFDLLGVRSFQPLVAPFAVDSYALERRVLLDPLAARMLRGVDRLGLVGVVILPGQLRRPLGVSRGLVGASDYRGATIGTQPSELGARTFRALGATPGEYEPGAEVSGFDGIEAGFAVVEGDRYDGPARTVAANVSLWPGAMAIVMNRAAYRALSDEQRQALRAAGRGAVEPTLADIVFREKEAVGVLCARRQIAFRSASGAELEALRATTDRVSRAVARDRANREAVRAIAAMRAEVEPEPAPTCAPSEGERAVEEETPLDGLWRMDTTAEELARIAPRGDVVAENWGTHTIALRAGRIAYTQENSDACTWGYGSYLVRGGVVAWAMEAGGGISPNDFHTRPGESYQFRWSRYRDRLTLEPAQGAISPPNFRVEPWRLVEDEASRGALSARCPPPRTALQR